MGGSNMADYMTLALGAALLLAVLLASSGENEEELAAGSASEAAAAASPLLSLLEHGRAALGALGACRCTIVGAVTAFVVLLAARASDSFRPWLIHQLVEYRAVVLVCFACPVSVLVWLQNLLRSRYAELTATPERHDERVAAVQQQNLSTRFVNKDVLHKIELGALRDVLEIRAPPAQRGTVRVEPSVTVGHITRRLEPTHMLAVCLELDDATLGGLAMGVGMTTASHIFGLYQETIVSMSVVLGSGELVRATRTNEHADLFRTLPWSHGSLGFLVELELMVIPAKPYVKLTYTPTTSQRECCALVRELSNAEPNGEGGGGGGRADFVEATVFEPELAVVMKGEFANVDTPEAAALINPISRWYKPWWYTHCEDICRAGEEVVEYVPLRHYILRHNRAIFWTLQDMIPPWFGNHWLFRYTFGWMIPPAISFLKFTTTAEFRHLTFSKQVFQDIVLPMTELETALDFADDLFGIMPVLIYPCRVFDHGEHSGQMRPPRPDQMVRNDSGMFFDLGVYGVPMPCKLKQRYDPVTPMRAMEQFIRDVGGYSFLYADTFMDEEELWQMFDRTLYAKVRRRYKAVGAFPELWDKVKPEVDVIAIGKQMADVIM